MLTDLPPLGYHRFVLEEPDSGQSMDMLLVIAPMRCYLPTILDDARQPEGREARVWGPALQLYASSSQASLGVGDYGDLLRVIDWCADQEGTHSLA